MRNQPLPLLIITGFLGSGKTSALRHWLAETPVLLERVAVVINDFGAVNVDATLLARRQLELRSITGGCVCCQSFAELVTQVATLAENPEIDLAWIETSGLADPEEVLDHLSEPELQAKAVIRRLVLLIDGTDFPCSWRGRAVQEEQVRYADVIILNKVDRLEAVEAMRIEIALRQLNPGAHIVRAEHGRVDPEILSRVSGESATAALQRAHAGGHDHSEHHGHEHVHDALPHSASTLFVPLEAAVPRRQFQQFLSALPISVFRAKGFVRFAETPDQVHTFQQVRDQAELVLLPLEDNVAPPCGLVLIGPHLDEARILRLAESSFLTAA